MLSATPDRAALLCISQQTGGHRCARIFTDCRPHYRAKPQTRLVNSVDFDTLFSLPCEPEELLPALGPLLSRVDTRGCFNQAW